MENKISIVIGSWGSYNACNERALGSNWIDLSDYEDWSEIVKELERQGFELDGIDEELFIQDVEGIETTGINCDYEIPKHFFEIIKKSGVLENDYKFELMQAYLEVRSFKEWQDLVEELGEDWDSDIYLYSQQSMEDVAYSIIEDCYNLEEPLASYFDYTKYADDLVFDGFTETSYGVIEIR